MKRERETPLATGFTNDDQRWIMPSRNGVDALANCLLGCRGWIGGRLARLE
jgi:hypothetical protein